MNVLKSMAIRSGHSEISVISQVSAIEGCPLSEVPLYSYRSIHMSEKQNLASHLAVFDG